MNGFGEVSSPKERDAYDSEKNQEIRTKGTEERLDDGSGFSKKELRDTPFSDSSDPFKEYFPDRVDTKQPSASDILTRDTDGKIRDGESGKCYESIADWKQKQETLGKRYEGIAEYWEKKAEEEKEAFQKINDEGEITVSDLKHYSHFQEYSLKAKENKEKAEAIWGKLESIESNIDEKGNSKFEDFNLEKSAGSDVNESKEPIQNKKDGLERERTVAEELKKMYPEEEGYEIIQEAYLRDKDGNIVKDPVTGEARRVDFVVVKDGKVVDSIEVTSQTADKTKQSEKEDRIRDAGGNYVRDKDGNLIEIPATVKTKIERRD